MMKLWFPMEIQSLHNARYASHLEAKKRLRPFPLLILSLIVVCNMFLWSCTEEGEPINKPDQFSCVYDAKEKFVLRAIAQIFNEKDLGRATINADAHEVTSDNFVQGEWRTRSFARVTQVNWNKCEVKLTIITEKKTPKGWEMRRLLGKDQYERILKAIELQIYREMYKS
jgi:hypothetical protein